MRRLSQLVASTFAVGFGMVLVGCSTGTVGDAPFPVTPPNPAVGNVTPRFNPTSGNPADIVLPNDLLRNPLTGLVDQFPNTPTFNAEPFLALKSMRGFSTTGNILIPFTGKIDGASVTSSSVLLIEGGNVTVPSDAGTNATIACNLSVVNPESSGAANATSTIIMQPIRPLKPLTNYFVIVTNGVTAQRRGVGSPGVGTATKSRDPLVSGSGNSQIFPVPDSSAASLEPLRQFYQPVWARAESILGRDRSEIPLVVRFGTQPLFAALPTLRGVAAAQNRNLVATVANATNTTEVDNLYTALNLTTVPRANIAQIHVGVMQTDNYISNATSGFFNGSGLPGEPITAVGTKNKNFFAFFPVNTTLGSPPPAVIFQHGITRSMSDAFGIADSLCQAGFAVVATDLVLHGDDTLPGQTSGTGFINLANLRNARDNVRQSAINLFYLTQLIKGGKMNFFGDAAADISTANPGYLGQSLGGIVGTVYSAIDPNSTTAVLNVPGGRITNLLLNSPGLRPSVIAGLGLAGVTEGTDTFTQFFLIAQTVVDDADPMNYIAPGLAGALKPGGANPARILVQEAVGDLVIPNSATRDMVNAASAFPLFRHVRPVVEALTLLTQVDATFSGSGYFQFPGVGHGILLDPLQGGLTNTSRVRVQAINFLATGFAGVPAIINPFLVFPRFEGNFDGIRIDNSEAGRAVTF
jgi:pimeloyl-ACP methyl ester carboxylesterase